MLQPVSRSPLWRLVRSCLVRWFRIPETIVYRRIEAKGQTVTAMTLDDWERMAGMFALLPGVREQLEMGLEAVREERKKLAKVPETFGSRMYLDGAESAYLNVLEFPSLALREAQKILDQQREEQMGAVKEKANVTSNLS